MKTPVTLIFILCAAICSSGCSLLDERQVVSVTQTPVPMETMTPVPTPERVTSTVEPAAMALQLSDLPGGYIVRERADIPYADAGPVARDQGWKKGYLVSFYRMEAEKYDLTSISQRIGVYHVDNVNLLDTTMKIVFEDAEDDVNDLGNDTVTVTELPFPKTGDRTSGFRIVDTNDTYGITRYVVLFTDKDVIEAIEMKGTTTDYEELKAIAAIAASKIR